VRDCTSVLAIKMEMFFPPKSHIAKPTDPGARKRDFSKIFSTHSTGSKSEWYNYVIETMCGTETRDGQTLNQETSLATENHEEVDCDGVKLACRECCKVWTLFEIFLGMRSCLVGELFWLVARLDIVNKVGQ